MLRSSLTCCCFVLAFGTQAAPAQPELQELWQEAVDEYPDVDFTAQGQTRHRH